MSTKIEVKIQNPSIIATRLKVNPGGKGEAFLTTEAARLMDPYVPMQTGILKNTKDIKPGSVTYIQPYAKKQYNDNKGRGLRGPQWDVRMMADRGAELVASVAKFLGGKPG